MRHAKQEATKAVIPFSEGHALVPVSLDEAIKYAQEIAKSDFVPKDYQGKPGNVLVAMQMGQEVGLKPLMSIQNIAVINGRPVIWGDVALALVRNSAKCLSIKESTPDKALAEGKGICTVQRVGEDPVTYTFTQADAVTAGLWKRQGPWTSYPGRMLQMRARSFALRDQFPDVLKGLNIAEEVMDYEVEKELLGGAQIVKPKRASETPEKPKDAVSAQPAQAPEGQQAKQAEPTTPVNLISKVAKSAVTQGRFFVFIGTEKYWTDNVDMAGLCDRLSKEKTPVVFDSGKEGELIEIGPEQG